jgi:hypothetical protein
LENNITKTKINNELERKRKKKKEPLDYQPGLKGDAPRRCLAAPLVPVDITNRD